MQYIKGTTKGIATDPTGNYAIQANKADTLSFSFIGHQTRVIPISGRQKIDVEMVPESIELNETVVTALGITQAEKAVGYSIQNISPDQLEKGGSGNIGNLLTGKVAGLSVSNPTTPTREILVVIPCLLTREALSIPILNRKNQPLTKQVFHPHFSGILLVLT